MSLFANKENVSRWWINGKRTDQFIAANEFWVFWGIALLEAVFGVDGADLWSENGGDIVCTTNMGQYKKEYRFKYTNGLVLVMFHYEEREESYNWFISFSAVEGFNNNR